MKLLHVHICTALQTSFVVDSICCRHLVLHNAQLLEYWQALGLPERASLERHQFYLVLLNCFKCGSPA
eukprot:14163-Heterococcus_DN1.PRE.3